MSTWFCKIKAIAFIGPLLKARYPVLTKRTSIKKTERAEEAFYQLNACCTSLITRTQIPSTHVKSSEWQHVSIISGLTRQRLKGLWGLVCPKKKNNQISIDVWLRCLLGIELWPPHTSKMHVHTHERVYTYTIHTRAWTWNVLSL